MELGAYRRKDDHDIVVQVKRVLKTKVEFVTTVQPVFTRPVAVDRKAFEAQYEPVPRERVYGWADLINEHGRVETYVMTAMARRRAIQQVGEVTPKSMREALAWVQDRIPALQERWKREHGIDVGGAPVSGLIINDGFGREA